MVEIYRGKPDSKSMYVEEPSDREEPFTVAGNVSERTALFLQEAYASSAFEGMQERKRTLISEYFQTDDATLADLKSTAGVTAIVSVRRLILSGMNHAWRNLPPHLKEKHPRDEIMRLKRGHSLRTRARISKANKGKPVSHETRKKISKTHKRRWQNPDYRKKILDARRKRPSPLLGRKHTSQAREKMRNSHLGKTTPPDIREKIRKACKERWRKKKEAGLLLTKPAHHEKT